MDVEDTRNLSEFARYIYIVSLSRQGSGQKLYRERLPVPSPFPRQSDNQIRGNSRRRDKRDKKSRARKEKGEKVCEIEIDGKHSRDEWDNRSCNFPLGEFFKGYGRDSRRM